MGVRVRLQMIKPTIKPDRAAVGRIRNELNSWAGEVIAVGRHYPPQWPSEYVRTGRYGKGWETEREPDGVVVINRVRYSPFVGGPWQTGDMAKRGWPNIEEAGHKIWDRRYRQRVQDLLEALIVVTATR